MISNTDVVNYLKVDTNAPTYAETMSFLAELCTAVDKEIVQMCNQSILTDTAVMDFMGNNTNFKAFENFPVKTVASLVSKLAIADPFTTISPTHYEIRNINGQKKLYYELKFENQYYYVLTYTYGYSTVPEDVLLVAKEMVALYYKESNFNDKRLGLQSAAQNIMNVQTTTTYKDMRPIWNTRLANYRKIPL